MVRTGGTRILRAGDATVVQHVRSIEVWAAAGRRDHPRALGRYQGRG